MGKDKEAKTKWLRNQDYVEPGPPQGRTAMAPEEPPAAEPKADIGS